MDEKNCWGGLVEFCWGVNVRNFFVVWERQEYRVFKAFFWGARRGLGAGGRVILDGQVLEVL